MYPLTALRPGCLGRCDWRNKWNAWCVANSCKLNIHFPCLQDWFYACAHPANERHCFKVTLGANLESALTFLSAYPVSILIPSHSYVVCFKELLLLTWINFNPSFDMWLHPVFIVGWRCVSISKMQLHCWSLRMDRICNFIKHFIVHVISDPCRDFSYTMLHFY